MEAPIACRQWRLRDLVLAKGKVFLGWSAKVHQFIFHPHLFSLIWCMWCMLLFLFAFATSNYILLVPYFNTRLSSKGLCECLYIFIGFHFHCTDCNQHLFQFSNMCWYFFLILELQNLVVAWGFSETLQEKSNPIFNISV